MNCCNFGVEKMTESEYFKTNTKTQQTSTEEIWR